MTGRGWTIHSAIRFSRSIDASGSTSSSVSVSVWIRRMPVSSGSSIRPIGASPDSYDRLSFTARVDGSSVPLVGKRVDCRSRLGCLRRDTRFHRIRRCLGGYRGFLVLAALFRVEVELVFTRMRVGDEHAADFLALGEA